MRTNLVLFCSKQVNTIQLACGRDCCPDEGSGQALRRNDVARIFQVSLAVPQTLLYPPEFPLL